MSTVTLTKAKVTTISNEPYLAAIEDDIKQMNEEAKNKEYKMEIVWRNVFLLAVFHILGAVGLYHFIFDIKWATVIWSLVCWVISGLGITAGAHRLWSHKSYRAKLPLRIALMIFNCMVFQLTVLEWSRDHRAHHKWTDSDADPHNISRGFFFSHIGWIMVKKHPQLKAKVDQIDMSDLEGDPILVFQRKYYFPLYMFWCFIFPTFVAVYFWGESAYLALMTAGFFRYIGTMNATWCVNSISHTFGWRTYNKTISPTDNVFTSIIAIGEGGHNYHHTFPQDYRTSASEYLNLTKMFIDLMYYIGQAYDLKTVSEEVIARQRARKGDPIRD
uniref:FA_desaturase domain-containing protein n=1 Tax=Rhabditophanes sp. KR3021 TaxID=114890 RepID=A0AC35TL18_9BILA